MLDAVDDRAVLVTEYNVGMFSHKLNNQCLMAQVPHLVEMLDLHVDDTLHMRLENTGDPAVGNVLTKHHAEGRCGHGAGFVLLGQI